MAEKKNGYTNGGFVQEQGDIKVSQYQTHLRLT